MIRGGIALALVMTSILFVGITSEGLLGFSASVRTGLMLALAGVFLAILGYAVLVPWSKMVNLTESLSDMEVAKIIRDFFPNVDDKLVNLLELKGQLGERESVLLAAAIEKKTEELAPIPFARAINLKVNWRFARYLGVPLLLFLLLALIRPDVLTNGTTRLVNFNREFIPPPPFRVNVMNHPDELVSGEGFELKAEVQGDELPGELFLYVKKSSEGEYVHYPMDKLRADAFEFEFRDVKENFNYKIGNEMAMTEPFSVEVLSRPAVRKFRVWLDYPGYTGLKDDTLPANVGDFKVVRGTKVRWILEPNTVVEKTEFVGLDTISFKSTSAPGVFVVERQALESESYFFNLVSKRGIPNTDTTRYQLDIIQDRYPTVFLNAKDEEFQADFTMFMPLDFEIADDYGFSRVTLNYRFTKSELESGKVGKDFQTIQIPVQGRELLQRKSMEVDLMGLGMEEGDAAEYLIKVWDNDMVSGPKAAVSAVYKINFPSLEEKFETVDKQQEQLEEKMERLVKDAKDIQEGMERFQEKALNQKALSFDDRKELQKLLDKNKSVQKEISEAQKQFKEHKENLENNQMLRQETLEKYEKLNALMEKLNNKEFNDYMEKLRKEMEKMNPAEMKQMMDQMQLKQEDLEQALERAMELMKQLEVQQKSEELLQKLDNLQKKQDMLSEKLSDAKKGDEESMKDLAEKQKSLSEEMEKVKQDLKDLAEKKKETSTPDQEKMDKLQQDAEDTKEEMNNAGQQMQQQDKKSGSQSQKNASQKMQDMEDSLSSMMQESQGEQDQENMDDLRYLLENLLKLSFKQEDLRDAMKGIRSNDPQLFAKEVEQKQLLDDMMMVKDSLDELAKRVFQIEKFVTDESNEIVQSMKSASVAMDEKFVPTAVENQHRAMTSINNLANMLTDVLQQMQQQMQQQKGGQSQCQKPGGGKPSMSNISKKQGQLNSMMQQMMQNGQGTDPKKLAEMAKMQEMIRQQLKEAHEQIQKGEGGSLGDMGKVMQDMKDTEDELKNQILTERTLKRQQLIMNRLLDSMKAVREKEEWEERRESNTGDELDKVAPDKLEEDELKNRLRQELLKSNQLEYSSDFMILIEKYFKLLEDAK
jgi:hypothetical protein